MADFTKTITNGINVFGNGPSTKWGQAFGVPYTMTWGTSTWGEGFSLIIDIEKVISNSITPDTAIHLSIDKIISESFSLQFETDQESLSQGVWFYVFPNNTTNLEERDFPSWSQGSASSTSYTCQAAGSTTWS